MKFYLYKKGAEQVLAMLKGCGVGGGEGEGMQTFWCSFNTKSLQF